MRRLAALTAVLMLVLAGCGVPAMERGKMTALVVQATVTTDNKAMVDMTVDYEFEGSNCRGIELFLQTAHPVGEGKVAVTPIEVVAAASSTGAPADVKTQNQRDRLRVLVGSEGSQVTGHHVYQLRYRVSGVSSPAEGGDQISLPVLDGSMKVPVQRVAVEVRTPMDVGAARCLAFSAGSETPCTMGKLTGGVPGSRTMAVPELAAPPKLGVNVSVPRGTITGPAPQTRSARGIPDRVGGLGTGLLGAALVLLLAAPAMGRLVRSRDLRELFGLSGSANAERPKMTVAQMTTLETLRGGPRAVSASVLALAQRGYLTISPGPGEMTLRLHGDHPMGALADYERAIWQELLERGRRAGGGWREPAVAWPFGGLAASDPLVRSTTDSVLASLAERGWIEPSVERRRSWQVIGAVLCAIGLVLTPMLALTVGHAALGLALGCAGVLVIGLSGMLPLRTPQGYETLSQLRLWSDSLSRPTEQSMQELPAAVAQGMTRLWTVEMPAELAPPDWFEATDADPGVWWAELSRFWRRPVPHEPAGEAGNR